MNQNRQETWNWYDDAEAIKVSDVPLVRADALPGLPASMEHSGWWLAGIAFSTLWMLQGWTEASGDPSVLGSMAESLWALLLALGICYGMYQFAKSQSKALAEFLCVVSAIVLLLNHVVMA